MSGFQHGKEKSLAEWLEQCPVQQEDPDIEGYDGDDKHLAPGPVLKACSGFDIYLQKAASTNKGKYLAILPGIVSWKNQSHLGQKGASSMQEDRVVSEPMANNGTTPKPEKAQSDETGARAPPQPQAALVSLGTIHNIDSERPSLSIPIPGSKVLKMNGRKIQTTSKFLVLSLQHKKGKVICKHVLDSALVFAHPCLTAQSRTESLKKMKGQPLSSIGTSFADSNALENDDDDATTDNNGGMSRIYHYGASLRVSDQNETGFVQRDATTSTTATTSIAFGRDTTGHKLVRRPNAETAPFEDENSSTSSPVQQPYHDPSSDTDNVDEHSQDIPLDTPQKRNSRRQSRVVVKYAESDDDDDEELGEESEMDDVDNGDEGNSSTGKARTPETSVQGQRRNSSLTRNSDSRRKGRATAPAANSSTQRRGLPEGGQDERSNEEQESCLRDVDEQTKRAVQKTGRGRKRKRPVVQGDSRPNEPGSSAANQKSEVLLTVDSEIEVETPVMDQCQDRKSKPIGKSNMTVKRPRRHSRSTVNCDEDKEEKNSNSEMDSVELNNQQDNEPTRPNAKQKRSLDDPACKAEELSTAGSEQDMSAGVEQQITNATSNCGGQHRSTAAMEIKESPHSDVSEIQLSKNKATRKTGQTKPQLFQMGEQEVETNNLNDCTTTTPEASKSRRSITTPFGRRKQSPRKSSAGKKTVIDLVDDDFQFLG